MRRYLQLLAVATGICSGCVVTAKQIDPTGDLAEAQVRPGITVLLGDSINLIRGKRIGLLTNQTGIDERGRSDIDMLRVSVLRTICPTCSIRTCADLRGRSTGSATWRAT